MILTAYRYDSQHHAYTGQALVRPQQLVNGGLIYELPRWSTLVEAPVFEKGEAAVFLEKTQHWVIVSDHRGETWFDWAGRPQPIDRLGNPAHWGLTWREPDREAG